MPMQGIAACFVIPNGSQDSISLSILWSKKSLLSDEIGVGIEFGQKVKVGEKTPALVTSSGKPSVLNNEYGGYFPVSTHFRLQQILRFPKQTETQKQFLGFSESGQALWLIRKMGEEGGDISFWLFADNSRLENLRNSAIPLTGECMNVIERDFSFLLCSCLTAVPSILRSPGPHILIDGGSEKFLIDEESGERVIC